jgi:DNA-binding response OmpR family regulator
MKRHDNGGGMAHGKVLVVDDEQLLVKSTCMAMKVYGFDTRGAMNADEAFSVLDEFTPDIIFLDIMMPGVDGWQVLARLKEGGKYADIPVVVFTAKEYSDGKALAQSKGAADYIAKPFDIEELVECARHNCA